MTRLYIAGPMSGIEDMNFPAFNEAAKQLADAGYEVVNPASFDVNIGKTWAECLRYDLARMLECDGVAVLPGYQGSRGARLETQVAEGCELPVFGADQWLTFSRAVKA